jgi:glycosyltransferase involved in cell wall biosynthesis
LLAALRRCGVQVEEAHVAVFERAADKSALTPWAAGRLTLRLAGAYLRLLPETALRLLRCDGLVIGYIGQGDMLALGGLAKLMGKPVLFNPLVTLTDTLVEDRRLVAERGVPARLVQTLDRQALQLATVTLADTPPNAAYLVERCEAAPEGVVVVPVGADETVFYPAEPASERTGGPLRVLFYGKFIPLHGVPVILRAAAELQRRGVPVSWELIGRGQEYAAARRLADELQLCNITWTDWVAPSRLGDRLRAADVALGIFDAGPKAARVVPNKVYQALACGRPVVTRSSAAAEWLLEDGVSALLVPPASPLAVADALERLTDEALRRRIGAGGRKIYTEYASAEALARALEPALRQIGVAAC